MTRIAFFIVFRELSDVSLKAKIESGYKVLLNSKGTSSLQKQRIKT